MMKKTIYTLCLFIFCMYSCDSAAFLVIENRTHKVSQVAVTFSDVGEYRVGTRSVKGDSVYIVKYIENKISDKFPLSYTDETTVLINFDDTIPYNKVTLLLSFGTSWSDSYIEYISNVIMSIQLTVGEKTELFEGKNEVKNFLTNRASKGRILLTE